ncbi:hypothetical protein Ancab_018874, partial [Ancistrocladus abbreviatus]
VRKNKIENISEDGLVSQESRVVGNIAFPNMTVTEIIKLLESKGFSVKEMVALVGAHNVGFSHCHELSRRAFHFSKEGFFHRSNLEPCLR